jgi:hypothetical protein
MVNVACVPEDLHMRLPETEKWFVQPWEDERAATELMRAADEVDSSEELQSDSSAR